MFNHFSEDDDLDEPIPEEAENLHSLIPFQHRKFKPKSLFNPTGPPTIEAFIIANENDLNHRPLHKWGPQNISPGERIALDSLRNNKNIIIKPADKGGAIVILNTDDYIQEGNSQLSNTKFYKPIDNDPTRIYTEEINNFIHQLFLKGEIDSQVATYLLEEETRTPYMYFLPKIHKKTRPPPGRPVVSGNGSATEKISEFVDHFINPPAKLIESYVQDTTHMLRILDQINHIPEDYILVTCDVSSLYTSIPTNEGIHSVKETLNNFRPEPNLKPTNESLTHLLELVLKRNNFKFAGQNYLQISGTAMGSKCSPSFAILYMDQFENQFIHKYHLKPFLYKRYIDDIFIIWQHGEKELLKFLNHINQCSPHIKFTWEFSTKSIDFLDLKIQNINGEIVTDLFTKPTDSHNYLNYNSAHPPTCKKSIPYSQFLRIRRICSNVEDFDKNTVLLSGHFLERDYPLELIQEAAIKARRLDRKELINKKSTQKQEEDKHILITTFHPHNDTLPKLVRKKLAYTRKKHSNYQHIQNTSPHSIQKTPKP